MARLCPLFSGSGGNSTYISSKGNGIIVDVGASFKGINEALQLVGGSFEEISAVAVTHTHSDHIKGLKTLLKRTELPLVASKDTLEELLKFDVIPQGTKIINAEDELEINGVLIKRFATSHDSIGSSGYVIGFESGEHVGVCTDLGTVTDEVRASLFGCDAVLIESNHDIEMLRRGPYPPHLKLRILSEEGHLSNGACAAELPELLKSGCKRFVLGHISMHNNLPALALASSRTMLANQGAVIGEDYILKAAKPTGNEVVVF